MNQILRDELAEIITEEMTRLGALHMCGVAGSPSGADRLLRVYINAKPSQRAAIDALVDAFEQG